MKFSKREINDLIFAGAMISLAFAILLAGGYNAIINFNQNLILLFIVSFFTAGIGFLLHELMHKYIAQRYKLWAEFVAFRGMLWLALLFSLFGFIFAAPGAVFIKGLITREKNGKISLAGPMTNITLSVLFLLGLFVFSRIELLNIVFIVGLKINSLLAAFNMIPLMPFDGAKVIAWNRGIYWITMIVAVGLFFVSYFI